MFGKVVLFAVVFATGAFAADPEVRFWVGYKSPATECADHVQFIAKTLVPATLVAGADGLTYYSVYLPPATELPAGAFASPSNSFSEAALPTYTDAAAYKRTRDAHPEYGPLHFEENGFDPATSFSAQPQLFKDTVSIATKESRVAYDLDPGSTADWRVGTTLVWYLLRREGDSEAAYLDKVNGLFRRMVADKTLILTTEGLYARVAEGHVLFFINLPPNKSHAAPVFARLRRLNEDSLIERDLVASTTREPFSAGWSKSITPGTLTNIQF